MHTGRSLDIDPAFSRVINPSVLRQLLSAMEFFHPIRQDYGWEEEKHIKFCRDETVREVSSHLPSIPYG